MTVKSAEYQIYIKRDGDMCDMHCQQFSMRENKQGFKEEYCKLFMKWVENRKPCDNCRNMIEILENYGGLGNNG
jgi:hypothetical protein